MKIILASASPRRQKLLKKIGLSFEVITSNIDERNIICAKIENTPIEIAKLKSRDIFNKILEDKIIIAADTVVIYNEEILGKPKDKEEAFKMLKILSGNECDIYTGLCVDVKIDNIYKQYTDLSKCTVKFKELSDIEIEEYIKTKEPMDKAGAFAMQGIGAKYIQNINGDFYAGVGISINKIYEILINIKKDFDIDFNI